MQSSDSVIFISFNAKTFWIMKAQWIVEFLNDHDFEYERNIGESEVWRNNSTIMVIHPDKGIQLIYKIELFTEDYTEDVIELDLKNHEEKMSAKN
jgi:hypothetical protein